MHLRTPVERIDTKMGIPVATADVSLATGGRDVHLVTAGVDGSMRYNLVRDGLWFTPQTLAWSGIRRVSVAADAGAVHVCAIDSAGSVVHAAKIGEGGWTALAPIGSMVWAAGTRFRSVACTLQGETINLLAVRDDGVLFFAMRSAES